MNVTLIKNLFRRGVPAREAPCEMSENRPGLVMALLDQSASMEVAWAHSGEPRKTVAARYVNQMLEECVLDCSSGSGYENRVFFALFGYSQARSGDDSDTFRLIAQGWPEQLASQIKDGGRWVEPVAFGSTPMHSVFRGARQYLEEFFSDGSRREIFRRSAPPVIVNITDGEANEFNESGGQRRLAKEFRRIARIEIPSGFAPLVFHAHISSDATHRAIFPTDPRALDEFGQLLFDVASEIPASWVRQRANRFDPPIQPGAVGVMMNSQPADLARLLRFVSEAV